MKIFLDVDEVLADFVGGACAVWGTTEAEVLPYWEPGVWNMIPPLSRALGLPVTLTEEEFWAAIVERGDRFWLNLRPLPWAGRVIDLVQSGYYTTPSGNRFPRILDNFVIQAGNVSINGYSDLDFATQGLAECVSNKWT